MVATLHFRSACSFASKINYCFEACIQFKTKNVRSLIKYIGLYSVGTRPSVFV